MYNFNFFKKCLMNVSGVICLCAAGGVTTSWAADAMDFETVLQQNQITGTVVDSGGAPVVGASVIVNGTNRAAITDGEGRFAIQASAGETVRVALIGFVSQDVNIDGGSPLNITLQPEVRSLDEVVVVGYGVQKKSVVTAAVSSVSSEQLTKNNPSDMRYALQGKVSGVQITSNSGSPGSQAVIRIRGNGTINDNSPLFLVDGFPAESDVINTINPADIKSIEILKDAASAAIYGARAANGVVLITTKNGAKGKAKVSYNFTYGIQNPWKKMDVVGAADYEMLVTESYENAGQKVPDGTFPKPEKRADTDWQDLVFNYNAPVVNHHLSVSGGNDNTQYYLSLGALNHDGIIAKGKSDYNRYNLRANLTVTAFENKNRNFLNKIRLGSNIGIEITNQKGIDQNQEFGGIIGSAIMAPPNIAPYEDDEEVIKNVYDVKYPGYVRNSAGRVYSVINNLNEIANPLALMEIRHHNHDKQAFMGNFFAELSVLPGLTFKSSLGGRYGYQQRRNWSPVYYLSSYIENEKSSVWQEKRNAFRWQWENVLSYNKTFGSVHNVSAVIGTSASKNRWEWLDGNDYELIAEDDDKAWINSATGDRSGERINGSMDNRALASIFGRAGYNYDEKYLFEATLRRDGSSNFAPNKRYAYFPSVSAGWVISSESFMESSSRWLNFMKLRLSWGQNGNENIGAFNYTSNMITGGESATFGTGEVIMPGMRPERLPNPELTWETSEQFNIGLDLALFRHSLTLGIDLFDKRTKDMLMELPIPDYVGNAAPQGNVGTMSNKGVEVEIGYRFNIGKVRFNTSGNVSYVKNKVTNIGKDRMIWGDGWQSQTLTYSKNGLPFKYFYGHVADGIFRSEEEVQAHKSANGVVLQPNAKPGDIRFKNLNGDDVINNDDRAYLGQSNPSWLFGLNLNAEWNGFDFAMFFQGQAGNMIYDATRRTELSLTNFQSKYLDRYHPTKNPNGNYPRVTIQDSNNNYRINSFFLHDGAFVRLKNVQLGYTLPKKVLTMLGIEKIRVFTSVENALTFTKYKGFDPEVGNNNGIDKGNYPQARIVNFGFNFTF